MVFAISGGLAAGPFQRDHGRSKQARVCGELLHRLPAPAARSSCCSDLPRIPRHADTPGHADRALYAADCVPDVSRLPVFSGKTVRLRVPPEMVLPVFVAVISSSRCDRISLAYSFRLHRAVSPEPAGRMEVLPRPQRNAAAVAQAAATAGRCGPSNPVPPLRIGRSQIRNRTIDRPG